MDTLVTTVPFDATDATAVPATVSGGATVAVNTDVNGDVIAIGTNSPGSGYSVGDSVTITEDGGSGVATARVAAIS